LPLRVPFQDYQEATAFAKSPQFPALASASSLADCGWIEFPAPQVAPLAIHTMLVEPGFFRTELLTPESTKKAKPSIDDYAEWNEQTLYVEQHERKAVTLGEPPKRSRHLFGAIPPWLSPPILLKLKAGRSSLP
jgi:hypothetical protein